jgi:2-aminoadipate transaminase
MGEAQSRKRALRQVDALTRHAATTAGLIPLAGGLPSEQQFPRRALADAFLRVVSQSGTPALQYGWPEGMQSLRERIASRLKARGLVNLEAADVLITNGAQQAITMAIELLTKPGQSIAVDAQSYPSALELFRSKGLTLVPMERAREASAVYVMPTVANPGGATMTAEARGRLGGIRRPIIEDEAYAELAFAGPPERPIAVDARERVFLVGTFSKTLCPGLRVGWLIVPPRWRQRSLRLKQATDLQSNSLAQAVTDEFLARDDFDRRLEILRRFYRQRARQLAAAIRRHLPSWRFDFPAGGFGLWVETDARVDEVAFLEAAVKEGVGFDPGMLFESWPHEGPTCLRLCFSLGRAIDFDEGARRLARAWRHLGGRRPPARPRPACPAPANRRRSGASAGFARRRR